MKEKAPRAYFDGFGTVKSVLELETLTAQEILGDAIRGAGGPASQPVEAGLQRGHPVGRWVTDRGVPVTGTASIAGSVTR